jgi:hypothetical protein
MVRGWGKERQSLQAVLDRASCFLPAPQAKLLFDHTCMAPHTVCTHLHGDICTVCQPAVHLLAWHSVPLFKCSPCPCCASPLPAAAPSLATCSRSTWPRVSGMMCPSSAVLGANSTATRFWHIQLCLSTCHASLVASARPGCTPLQAA